MFTLVRRQGGSQGNVLSMSFFSPDSGSDVAPVGLDLFSLPPNQVAILKQYYEDVRPISQYHGLNPLSFEVNLQDVYTDLVKYKLLLKVCILKADGSRLVPGDHVTPANLMFHAMFSEIDIRMNGTLVHSSGNMYPYIAYVHSLLRKSKQTKKTKLTEQLFSHLCPYKIGCQLM